MVSFAKSIFLVISLLILPGVLFANVPEGMRSLEIRVTDHQAGIEDFQNLGVRLQSVSIHPKGAARREGWIVLERAFPLIDIVPLKNGLYESAGVFDVPTGNYDAVKIEFLNIEGDLHSNDSLSISADNTTVATSINLTTEPQLALVLDLYVESQTDHEDGLYVVKVKEIRVE